VARRVLPETDSTNDEAVRQFPGLTGPTWILALHQSAARGRRGRPWANPAGNFAATLVLPRRMPAVLAAQHSFVAALALFDAFVATTGRVAPFALKWPNDVLLNGGKVAGILLESIRQGNELAGLSIGFGVNLAAAPAVDEIAGDALRPVALASETGAVVSPEEFLDFLAPAFARNAAQMEQYGFAPIREAWLARAARLGQTITARTGTNTVSGIFETVDETGQLILKTPKGRHVIAAADVFF